MLQILGIILLVGGLIAAVVGLQDAFGMRERAARLILGRFTRRTLALLVGGGAAALIGLLLMT
ncbi:MULTISPECIES: DUF3185 family protein [unclassified Thioalkalivibrio]|uniref:DUF3185 family protein n=1 Tax=unclassified Thioalkalivibrio TaxID=2621013 RepID=UPI000477FE0E|nr:MULTISPECIES: DUF3185 family protein [unclassified Thioalkalivibrio]